MSARISAAILLGLVLGASVMMACSQATSPQEKPLGRYAGRVGEHLVYIFSVEGTQCIALDRYNSTAISCDWAKP